MRRRLLHHFTRAPKPSIHLHNPLRPPQNILIALRPIRILRQSLIIITPWRSTIPARTHGQLIQLDTHRLQRHIVALQFLADDRVHFVEEGAAGCGDVARELLVFVHAGFDVELEGRLVAVAGLVVVVEGVEDYGMFELGGESGQGWHVDEGSGVVGSLEVVCSLNGKSEEEQGEFQNRVLDEEQRLFKVHLSQLQYLKRKAARWQE